MDKEHAKGAADKVSGNIKQGIGNVTGDESMKIKGKVDQAKGEARDKLGDAKDAMKDKN